MCGSGLPPFAHFGKEVPAGITMPPKAAVLCRTWNHGHVPRSTPTPPGDLYDPDLTPPHLGWAHQAFDLLYGRSGFTF